MPPASPTTISPAGAQLGRGALYRFSQGDSRALADQFDKIADLYEVVTRRPLPPPEY